MQHACASYLTIAGTLPLPDLRRGMSLFLAPERGGISRAAGRAVLEIHVTRATAYAHLPLERLKYENHKSQDGLALDPTLSHSAGYSTSFSSTMRYLASQEG